MDMEHDLSLVDEKYRKIVETLLEYEDSLSDGYIFYCKYSYTEEEALLYKDDEVLTALVNIAKEILGEE